MNKNHAEATSMVTPKEFATALFIGVPALLLTSLGFYIAISGLVVIFLELAL